MQQQQTESIVPLVKAPHSEQEEPLQMKNIHNIEKLQHKANSYQFPRQSHVKTLEIEGQKQEPQNEKQAPPFHTKQEQFMLNKYALSKIFKHMKKIHLLQKNLSFIISYLAQSETLYLSSLEQLQQLQHSNIQYLIRENILNEDLCENLFGYNLTNGNWNNIFKITKKQLDVLSELIIRKDGSKMLAQLERMIELYQVYSQEYTKIVNILWIIDMLEQKLLNLLIQGEASQYNGKRTSTKFVVDHCSSQNIVVESEIMDEEQIPTKHSRKSQQSETSQTMTKQCKHEILLNIISIIRKSIFLPLRKISQYIQYFTKYMRTFVELHQQLNQTIKIKVKGNAKQANIQQQQLQQLNNTKHIIRKSKLCIQKFLIILTKTLDCNFSNMNDHDTEIVKQLTLLFPELFYNQFQLDDKQDNQGGKTSSGYNVCGPKDVDTQEDEDQYSTPFVISFGTFDTYCMGKPCEIFLVKNHLIIIQDTHPQIPASSVSLSKLKTKQKQIQIHKLCIIQIDHTTNIQIVAHHMLYHKQLMYISGGQYSNGVYIEFRGRRTNPVQNQMLQKHRKQCDDVACLLCANKFMEKWQYLLAESNMNILKTIVELKISYNIYVFNCHEIGITTNKQQQTLRLNRQTNRMKNIQMRVIKPKPSQQQQQAAKNCYVFEDQNIITGCHQVRVQVLAVQYRYEKQDKFYVMRLSVYDYSNSHNEGGLSNAIALRDADQKQYRLSGRDRYMSVNYKMYSQTLYISEYKLQDIEQYIFKAFPSMLTVNKANNKSNHMIYYNIMKLQQYRQLFYRADFENERIVQFECMIITDLFNSIFKTNQFKSKPELILAKFGICEGMWQILISRRFNSYYQHSSSSGNFSLFGLRSKKQCRCMQCLGYSQSSIGQHIDLVHGKSNNIGRFWKCYEFALAFPQICHKKSKIKQKLQQPIPGMQKIKKSISYQQNNKKFSNFMQSTKSVKNRKIFKNKKNPICPLYGQKVEFDYISSVSKLIKQSKDRKERLRLDQQIVQYFDKIKYLKYISNGNNIINNNLNYNVTSIEYDLFNHVIKTGRTKSLTLILYCLPNLHDYFHNLETPPNKKLSKNQSAQSNIFKQIQDQVIDINSPQNHGFTAKLMTNIHKDATCKHVKYMIGKKLGICEEHIGHFMETYALTVVKKQESKVQQSFINSAISKLLFSKQVPIKINYYIREIYILHDFQMIFDVLDRLNQLNQKENQRYYISIKKILKIDPLLIFQNIKQKQQDDSHIIESYKNLLQFELAQIWYRFNQQQILIREQPDSFLIKYITLTFSYLLSKLKNKQKYESKFSEKLLIKTGIFSKNIIQQYYNFGLTELSGDQQQKKEIAQKNLQIKKFRRNNLMNILSAQLQSKQSSNSILNKLLRIVYDQTSWNLLIQHIIYIDNQIKIHYNHRHIFISSDGIVIEQKNNPSQNKMLQENMSIMKSQFKKIKQPEEQHLIQLNYSQINVQLFGSIIVITHKQIENSFNQKKMPSKYIFFTANQYKIFDIIKFYIAWGENNQIEDLSHEQSKLKKKFDQQKLRAKTLQKNSRIFMKKHERASKRRSQVFGLSDQKNLMKIKLQQQLFSKKRNQDEES